MSANEILSEQFVPRRAAQLKAEGHSLVRQLPPKKGTVEASKKVHPAGKKVPLHSVKD